MLISIACLISVLTLFHMALPYQFAITKHLANTRPHNNLLSDWCTRDYCAMLSGIQYYRNLGLRHRSHVNAPIISSHHRKRGRNHPAALWILVQQHTSSQIEQFVHRDRLLPPLWWVTLTSGT